MIGTPLVPQLLELGAPGIYNVVDDEPAPHPQWLRILAQALGADPPAPVETPPPTDDPVMTQRGASNAKVKRELGWRPRYASWREGFPRAWRERVADPAEADHSAEGEPDGGCRECHPQAAEVQRAAGDARDRVVDAGCDSGVVLIGVGEDRRRRRRDEDREPEREDRRAPGGRRAGTRESRNTRPCWLRSRHSSARATCKDRVGGCR